MDDYKSIYGATKGGVKKIVKSGWGFLFMILKVVSNNLVLLKSYDESAALWSKTAIFR